MIPLRFASSSPRDRRGSSSTRSATSPTARRARWVTRLRSAARAVSSHVTLVSGPTFPHAPKNVEFVSVTTAQEMADAVWSRFRRWIFASWRRRCAIFVRRTTARSKIKKGSFGGVLELEPTPDILAELGRRKKSQVLVGFAAETDDVEKSCTREADAQEARFHCRERCQRVRCRDKSRDILSGDGKIERLVRTAEDRGGDGDCRTSGAA